MAQPQPVGATADVRDVAGRLLATAEFREGRGEVLITLIFASPAPLGTHAVHIQEVGRCDPPDFASAGVDFNPYGKKHGRQNPDGPHVGDLPNVNFTNGLTTYNTSAPGATLGAGPGSLLSPNRALVIYAGEDDQMTDPDGKAGARTGCGVIAAAPGPGAVAPPKPAAPQPAAQSAAQGAAQSAAPPPVAQSTNPTPQPTPAAATRPPAPPPTPVPNPAANKPAAQPAQPGAPAAQSGGGQPALSGAQPAQPGGAPSAQPGGGQPALSGAPPAQPGAQPAAQPAVPRPASSPAPAGALAASPIPIPIVAAAPTPALATSAPSGGTSLGTGPALIVAVLGVALIGAGYLLRQRSQLR